MPISTAEPLRDRSAFITGGSRGIGLAIACKLAAAGANVAIAAKTIEPHPRLEGTIHTARAAIQASARHGARVEAIQMDVRDDASVEAAIAQAAQAARNAERRVDGIGWPPERFSGRVAKVWCSRRGCVKPFAESTRRGARFRGRSPLPPAAAAARRRRSCRRLRRLRIDRRHRVAAAVTAATASRSVRPTTTGRPAGRWATTRHRLSGPPRGPFTSVR